MNFIISSCTLEKQTRALWAEVPHTVLHMLFVFCFGGSSFMWFAISLSAIKLFWIPIMNKFVVILFLPDWKCSETAAKTLMLNYGATDDRVMKAVYDVAVEQHFTWLLKEFFA